MLYFLLDSVLIIEVHIQCLTTSFNNLIVVGVDEGKVTEEPTTEEFDIEESDAEESLREAA